VGGGFLGTHVAAGFTAAETPTTILTRTAPTTGSLAAAAATRLVEGDAADTDVLDDALTGCGHVVWCAGGLLPAESNADPIGDVLWSLPAFLTALEALRRRPGVGLTFFSSGGAVYGDPHVLPVSETHPVAPRTSYAVMKVAAEHYLALYRTRHGIPGLALRCGNVFGAGQPADRSQGLVAAALARVRAGQPVPVYGDGRIVRDYVHVDDVVAVVLALARRPDMPAVLNVGSGRGTSVTELLTLIEEVTGLAVQVERHPVRPDDIQRVVLDISLLQSTMAFEPRSLRDGLARTWTATNEAASTLR
jgi:UDP-glucose 4-epimerase